MQITRGGFIASLASGALGAVLGYRQRNAIGGDAALIAAERGQYGGEPIRVYDVSHPDFAGGAKGDGSTDDAPAIQACADSIEANGGGVMFFPPGSYLINAQVSSAASDLVLELGDAIILNTSRLPLAVRDGFDTNPLFLFTGERVRVHGGHFRDCLSQGIVISGAFAGGDTYAGAAFTSGHHVEGTVFENGDGDSLHIRFFNDVEVSGVTVKDKGAGLAGGHASEVAVMYGRNARLTGCTVTDARNGGGFYGLYVDGLEWSGCSADVTNAHEASKQSCDAYYCSHSRNVTLTRSQGNTPEGGVAFKAALGSSGIRCTANTLKCAGRGGAPYAAVLMQGTEGFLIADNTLESYDGSVVRVSFDTSPGVRNSRNGRITGNRITTRYNPGVAKVDGDGVEIREDSGDGYGPMEVADNRFEEGNLYLLQVKQSGSVRRNIFYTAADHVDTSATIFADRCYGLEVEENVLINMNGSDRAKVGIWLVDPSYCRVRGNSVIFANSVARSVAYKQTGTANATRWEERNRSLNAAQHSIGIRAAGPAAG